VSPFAGQVFTMRFGHWDHDVSVHAPQVILPDGMPRRVRVTHEVLDFMFGDGQAMTALVNATVMNSRVDPRLQTLIDQAAGRMGLGTPPEQFIAEVEAVVAQASLAASDDHVMIAMRRLKRVVAEYRTWAKVAAD